MNTALALSGVLMVATVATGLLPAKRSSFRHFLWTSLKFIRTTSGHLLIQQKHLASSNHSPYSFKHHQFLTHIRPFQRKLWHRLTGKRSLERAFLGRERQAPFAQIGSQSVSYTSVPTCWMQPQYLSAAWIHVCVSILIIDRIGLEKIGYDNVG